MSTEPTKADFHDALARVFSKVKRASKDRNNPAFKSRYATLAAVCDACEDALNEYEFAYPQEAYTVVNEHAVECVVETVLLWKGHEYRSGKVTIPLARNATAQQIGSAFTYARRYSLSATLAVCPDDDDDDGNAASRAPRESGPDPRWASLKALTEDVATRRGCSVGDAQDLVCERAGVQGRPQDRDLPTLMDAAKAILREVSEPASKTPRGKVKPAAEKPDPTQSTDPVAPHRAQFQVAYRAYKAACEARKLTPLGWIEMASEAIGQTWNTTAGSHGAEDYDKAADHCEKAVAKMRSEGAAA